MAYWRAFVALVLAIVAGVGVPCPVRAAGSGANRDLERVIERGSYRESGTAQIARAFRVAVDAGVQDREALALVESAVNGDFTADQVVRILTIATQLSLEDLPTDLFLLKVREGVSKRVEAGRVVQAAERRALTLKLASNIFKQLALDGLSVSDRAALLPDVAEALESGMDQGRVREILAGAVGNGDDAAAIRRKLFP